MYLLGQEVERQGDANGEAEFQQLLQKILAEQPGNPAALLELGRVAAKRGDAQTLRSVVAEIGAHAATWPPEVQPQWAALQSAAAGPDPRAAAVRIAFLRNSLMRTPDFRQSLSLIQPAAGNEATPFTRLPAAAHAHIYSAAGRYGHPLSGPRPSPLSTNSRRSRGAGSEPSR